MAKQQQFNFTLGTLVTREIFGNSIYWGKATDDTSPNDRTKTTAGSGDLSVDQARRDSANVNVYQERLFFKFDLSSLPLNAVITSAVLTVHFRTFHFNNVPFPIPFGVYRVFQSPLPDLTNASFQNRVGGGTPVAWARYGAVDGVDYRATEEATASVSAAEAPGAGVPSSDDDVTKTFDLTNFAKYVMNTDSRQMVGILGRTDANRRVYPNLDGGVFDPLSEGSVITLWNDVSRQPLLVVTYIDALTFHPAFADGSIDSNTIIDTTAGGIYLFDPLRVGGSGTAKKFFVRNNLGSSVSLLNVFSQRSYGSKIFEMTRSTVGTGTISDITTVDKSVNQTNYTITEQWRVTFTSATNFTVERDTGTLDDPTQTDTWSAASPSTGTVGSLYTDTVRGVSFTITAGGTAFSAGDVIMFRTYEDDAHPSAPADSDTFLSIAPDLSNTPGTYQPMTWKPTVASSNVVTNTVIPVADTTIFAVGQTLKIYNRTTGSLIGSRTVMAISVGVSITVDSNVTLSQGDYVEPDRIGVTTLAAGQAMPFWIQPSAPLTAVRETKYPRWRAAAA